MLPSDRVSIIVWDDLAPYRAVAAARDALYLRRFAETPAPPRVADTASTRALASVRALPGWVAGYAAVWRVAMPSKGGRHFGDHALASNLTRDCVGLWLNHETPSIAVAGTALHLECDSYGLWFEGAIAVPSILAAVRERRATGCSPGWRDTFSTGDTITGVSALTEISILTPPHHPACASTWALPGAIATTRRLTTLNGLSRLSQ